MSSPAVFLREVRRHLGYHEASDGSSVFGKWYGKRVHDTSFASGAWCDMFLSYCGVKTDSPVGVFAWTVAHAKWFQQQGRFNRTPKRGSLVFFDWSGGRSLDGIDHIGVVEKVRPDGLLVTLEGNTADQVARRVRSMNSVVGFGHPKWRRKVTTSKAKLDRKYRLVATTRSGGVRFVYRQPSGYSWRKGKHGRKAMTGREAKAAVAWAQKRKAKTTRVLKPGQYSHLRLDPSTHWPLDKGLCRRLNEVGQRMHRIIYIKSGHRTLAEQQYLWDLYQAGRGNLAAYPNPNAPHVRGVAADCGVIDRKGRYKSLGLNGRARKLAEGLGLRAWVPGEAWHWQRQETY